jgi:hypothetical protein
MKDPGRDQSIERMLARMRESDGENCPDAETLAAWTDATLGADQRSRVEAHVAGCARCQMQLAAMVRMAPPTDAAAAPPHGRVRLMPWLVPITGAVAAAGLWILVQSPRTPVQHARALPEAPRQLQVQQEKEAREADQLASTPPPAASRTARQDAEPKRERRMLKDLAAAPSEPAASAPAVSAPAALDETITGASAAQNADALIRDLKVQRSVDGVVRWEARPSSITERVLAGASPSPSVIWLVGKDGLVLLTTNGRTWRAVPFPHNVDLTAIQATDETSATVTTADGRTFGTSDGGMTWKP